MRSLQQCLHLGVDLGLKPVYQGRARVHHRLAELGLALQLDGLDILRLNDSRTDLVGEARDERGVYRVVLGQIPLGPCELPYAQGVGIRDGHIELVQKGDELKLVTACRLHADRSLGLSCEIPEFPETLYPVVQCSRHRAKTFLLRRNEHIKFFFGNINSDVTNV